MTSGNVETDRCCLTAQPELVNRDADPSCRSVESSLDEMHGVGKQTTGGGVLGRNQKCKQRITSG